MHCYEYRTNKTSKKWFWKRLKLRLKFVQVNEQSSFWKNYGKFEKYRDIKLVTTEEII